MMTRTVRPGYFERTWQSVTLSIDVDLESGSVFRFSENHGRTCVDFLKQQPEDFAIIYTDGSVDPVSGRAGCGFYIERDDFRYGLALQPFTSVLSAELYAILRAVHYSSRAGMNRVFVLSDSWGTLYCLRDCFAVSVRNYIFLKIAHILVDLRDLGRVVEYMWVPGHVGIAGNDAADQVARAEGGLPYRIRNGLPFCDLFDPVGRDFESWVRLL